MPASLIALPMVSDGTRPFVEACRQERMAIQRCSVCRSFRWPPSRACPECHASAAEWETVSGEGVVEGYAVVHRTFDPAFVDEVPYVVALVALSNTGDNVVMLSNVVGCEPAEVFVGMAVRPVYHQLAEDIVIPRFEPDHRSCRPDRGEGRND